MRFGSEDSEVPDQQAVVDEEQEKSIAVLPFVNMSDDPDNEYFSDGISEELLNVLVKVEGLRVASRTSSFSFKDKDTSIPDIADALNVEHVLEGSVRKSGDTVRITAQLIDVRTDSHLWSETYDRKLEDVFVIQDEISAHIVEALRVALGTGEVVQTTGRPTDNLDAYEDYLRGRHFWQRRGEENIRKAIELFEGAVAADPGFARALSSLAAAHLTMPMYSSESEDHHYPLALQYANKALELDLDIAESHAVIAELLRAENRWTEAESYYLKAIQLEPGNATGYLWYAEQLASVGNREKCLVNALKALELDPFSAGTNSMATYAYLINDDWESAKKFAQAAWDLGHRYSIFELIELEIREGNIDDAMRIVEEHSGSLDDDDVTYFRMLAEATADPDRVDAYLELTAGHPNQLPLFVAIDNIVFGRVEEGMEILLEIPIDGNEWMNIWRPHLTALRQHSGFTKLVEANGLDQYWDEFGWPSQCQRDGSTVTCN